MADIHDYREFSTVRPCPPLTTPRSKLSEFSETPALAGSIPAQLRGDDNPRSHGFELLNAAPRSVAETALLSCCGSRRWAGRVAEHRPYPDAETLLAAADEASYDMTAADLAEALAEEAVGGQPVLGLHSLGSRAAGTALLAACNAYESRFGHTFVICLDGLGPEELLDHVLTGIRRRLGNPADTERAVVAEEMRRMARGRLARLITEPAGKGRCLPGAGEAPEERDGMP